MGDQELSYSIQWEPISEAENNQRKLMFNVEHSRELYSIKSTPGNLYMPRFFLQGAEKIYNFQVRPSDVWLITYPKCGTTLTQEILWQITRDVKPEDATIPIFKRSPFLEINYLQDPEKNTDEVVKNMIEIAQNSTSPRIIKTHLPFEMLPPSLLDVAKVVYVYRNPLDTCNSYYHHQKNLSRPYGLVGTIDDFCQLFAKGQINYGDYFYNLKSAYRRRESPNLKIMSYEDMVADMKASIKDLGQFLAHDLSEEQVQMIENVVQIDNFRETLTWTENSQGQKDNIKKFVRKGKVGDFKNHFSEATINKLKAWVEQNMKDDLEGLDFVYELSQE